MKYKDYSARLNSFYELRGEKPNDEIVTTSVQESDVEVTSGGDDSLIDVEFSPDVNVTIPTSGLVAAGTAAGGSAVGATATTTAAAGTSGFVAALPVVGQVVAVVATLVAIGQMINSVEKQKQLQLAIKNLQEKDKAIKQELDIQLWEGNQKLAIINKAIEDAYEQEKLNKTLQTATIVVLGVSTMIFVYSLRKNEKERSIKYCRSISPFDGGVFWCSLLKT